MPDTTYSVLDLRTQLVANGYSPLPNVGKACYLEGWPKVEITPEVLARWSRRHSRFQDTGLRVENGLAVIDLDINDEAGAAAVAAAIEAEFPALLSALVRYGKGYKEAWFCRTAEPFSRIHTFRFWAPGLNDPDVNEAHCVEIFGGGSPRQFGAFGAHTRDKAGDVVVAYEWAGDFGPDQGPDWAPQSPANTPLADLPELSKADFFKIAEIAEATLRARNFEQVTRSTSGESEAVRVYDLTDDMVFECNDEVTRSLAELRDVAGQEGLRCSASWLEPGRGHSLTRCLVGRSHSGQLTIWDSASGTTHMPADADPGDLPAAAAQLDTDALAARLIRLRDLESEKKARRRAKLSVDDDHMAAAAKATQTWALCPGQQAAVVPIWADAIGEGAMTVTNFRHMMAPWTGHELGPRGGDVKISPVDLWLASKDRLTLEGQRLRPDMPRPTYEERGKLYSNVYKPELHPESGGDAWGGIELLEQLLPEQAEREWFTRWLAYKWLHPATPGPAVLMVARRFGTGRGTLGELIKRIFGSRYVNELGFDHFVGRTTQSQYTGWQADSLVVLVNESSTADNGSTFRTKHDTYERLKEIVEPRPRERLIVEKYTKSYRALTPASYVIFTNNPDALPLPPEDRRFAVLANGDPRDVEYWERINAWMGEPENVGAFVRWLEAYDMADYSPFAVPIKTASKEAMSGFALSPIDLALEEALRELPGELVLPDQLLSAMRKLRDEHSYDFPERWEIGAKRGMQKLLLRVGEKDGPSWVLKVDSKRHPIYARTRQHSTKWAVAEAEERRREVLRNGAPGSDKSVAEALARIKLAVDNSKT